MSANRPHFLKKSLSHAQFLFFHQISETAARKISQEDMNMFKNYISTTNSLCSLKIRDVHDEPDGETSHLTVAEGQEVLTKTVMEYKTTTTNNNRKLFICFEVINKHPLGDSL